MFCSLELTGQEICHGAGGIHGEAESCEDAQILKTRAYPAAWSMATKGPSVLYNGVGRTIVLMTHHCLSETGACAFRYYDLFVSRCVERALQLQQPPPRLGAPPIGDPLPCMHEQVEPLIHLKAIALIQYPGVVDLNIRWSQYQDHSSSYIPAQGHHCANSDTNH